MAVQKPDLKTAAGAPPEWAAKLGSSLDESASQTALLRQQVGQMFDAVKQLYGAVGTQCVQLRDSDQALLQELQKFQTGGPQRAMSAVFFKLFRDLLKHMNQLDEIVAMGEAGGNQSVDAAWLKALCVERDHYEAILKEWGCLPMAIRIGHEDFDPEIHEAAPTSQKDAEKSSGNKVIAVRRRGWTLSGQLLQHPLVNVG